MKRILFVLAVLLGLQLCGAEIYRGYSTSGNAAYNYDARNMQLYRGYSTSGSAAFTYEAGNTPRISRGYSRSGNSIYTFEYSGNII